jgi:hypothetical protein
MQRAAGVSSVLVSIIQAIVTLSLVALERGRWLPTGQTAQEKQLAP